MIEASPTGFNISYEIDVTNLVDAIPARPSAWDVPGLRGAVTLGAAIAYLDESEQIYRAAAR